MIFSRKRRPVSELEVEVKREGLKGVRDEGGVLEGFEE